MKWNLFLLFKGKNQKEETRFCCSECQKRAWVKNVLNKAIKIKWWSCYTSCQVILRKITFLLLWIRRMPPARVSEEGIWFLWQLRLYILPKMENCAFCLLLFPLRLWPIFFFFLEGLLLRNNYSYSQPKHPYLRSLDNWTTVKYFVLYCGGSSFFPVLPSMSCWGPMYPVRFVLFSWLLWQEEINSTFVHSGWFFSLITLKNNYIKLK